MSPPSLKHFSIGGVRQNIVGGRRSITILFRRGIVFTKDPTWASYWVWKLMSRLSGKVVRGMLFWNASLNTPNAAYMLCRLWVSDSIAACAI
jgi:hypothetical protein